MCHEMFVDEKTAPGISCILIVSIKGGCLTLQNQCKRENISANKKQKQKHVQTTWRKQSVKLLHGNVASFI